MLFLCFPVVMSDTLKDITFLIVLNKTTRFCDDIIFLVKSKQAILNCKPLKMFGHLNLLRYTGCLY